jgi:hypothetical protein
MKNIFQILFLISCSAFAQFASIIGEEGCIAIPMDSPMFVSWAEQGEVERGWVNIADTTLGKVTFGEIDYCFGAPNPAVLSLGDGGFVTLFFEQNLFNGEGYDFAVFENAFDAYFLELAFVEVSSDGENFFRFESQSLSNIENQMGPFDFLATELIHNLAGKYPAQWGTPFDLNELSDISGLDINAISHIRIVDVVGSLDPIYANTDSYGRIINEPWPTAFASGGFDLDAVGIIHQNPLSIEEHSDLLIYPNPVDMQSALRLKSAHPIENIKLIDALGSVKIINFNTEINLSQYIAHKGLYILEYEILGKRNRQKIIIR